MILSRVLLDGAVVSVLAAALIFGSIRANPRLWLNDFPPDIRGAVPPKTVAEKRLSLVWGLPFLAVLFGGPVVSCLLLEQQLGGTSSFTALFLDAFGVALFFNAFDLLIVDWLVLCGFTPRMAVIPGTEGMAGYKDYGYHFRGFLIGIAASGVIATMAATIVYFT
jgi:hypothetical protein